MRIQSMKSLNEAASQVEQGFRIHWTAPLVAAQRVKIDDLKQHLKPAPAGRRGSEIRVVLHLGDMVRDVEIPVPGRFDVPPNVLVRITTIPGVVDVQEL